MPKSKLPERWEKYSNIGNVISGTRIFSFKVPLNEYLCSRYPEELWFTPHTLMETTEENGTPLGLIIDLTFTSRYYNPQVFTDQGIDHRKIFVPGKEVPTPDIIEEFCDAIDDFTSDPNNIDKLVGVHCTHGVNRTGHLVCRYMIDRLNIEPEVAIKAYGEARGYPIERENYLADLRRKPGEENEALENPTNKVENGEVHKTRDGTRHDDGPQSKKKIPNSYYRHSNSQDRYDQGTRLTDMEQYRERNVRNDYRGEGYRGEGRDQHWYNNQNGHRSDNRNWRSHTGNYSVEATSHTSVQNRSSGSHSHNSREEDRNHSSSYYGDNRNYHGNHARGQGAGGYSSQNHRNWGASYNDRSESWNSYNPRTPQSSRGGRQGGGWSLNSDTGYGQYGYSNYGNRSHDQQPPFDNRSESSRGRKQRH